jgi:hypothetical protein
MKSKSAMPSVSQSAVESPVAPVAPLSPVASSLFDFFPHHYALSLGAVETAIESRDAGAIESAFIALGELKPVAVKLPHDATRDEKFDARDSFKLAVSVHQRALRVAFGLAKDAGAVVTEKFSGSVNPNNHAVTMRHNVSAKLAPAKRATVRL